MIFRRKMIVFLLLSAVALSAITDCRTDKNHSSPQAAVSARPTKWLMTSNLPIVMIDTFSRWIPDEPKIPARLRIVYDDSGERNFVESPHVHFEGTVGIEIRGKSSQMYPKKQYGFEIWGDKGGDMKASLLQMPAESDWILYAPYSDKTLMRNFLAYNFSNRIGRYAARTKFVELFLNDTGDAEIRPRHYMGVYLLMEKIKRGKDRVDIQPLDASYRKAPEITGGYILKIDKLDPGDSYFFTDCGTRLIHVYPKGDRINDAQKAWIQNYMNAFEAALLGVNFKDPKRGYARYIDTSSFIDYFIINEVFKNVDAFRLSAFMYKDRNKKLKMGPIWDFNISMGNANYYNGWRYDGWIFQEIPPSEGYPIPFWWGKLLEDEDFAQQLIERWKALRRDELALSNLMTTIDQTADYLSEAQVRNFQRWPILGYYVWPNPRPYSHTYGEEVRRLKKWLSNRIQWMDGHIELLRP